MNKNAIVFLTRDLPDINLISFCKELETDILHNYICIGNFNDDTSNIKVKILKYNNEECKNRGFINSILPRTINNEWRPSAWDKALYHFCVKDTSFDNVYFVEDDVFISSKEVIYNLDKKYKNIDLLCESNKNYNDDKIWHNWKIINETQIKKPWFHSMMCACRLSKKLLELILEYATKHNQLLFIEIIFNTLVAHNNLTILNPIEFQNIYAIYEWKSKYLEYGLLYHPIKDQEKHTKYRKILEKRKDKKIMMDFKIIMYDKTFINENNKFKLFLYYLKNQLVIKNIKKKYFMSYNVNRFDNFITDIDKNFFSVIDLIKQYSNNLKFVLLIECPFDKIDIITKKLKLLYNFNYNVNNSDNNTKLLLLSNSKYINDIKSVSIFLSSDELIEITITTITNLDKPLQTKYSKYYTENNNYNNITIFSKINKNIIILYTNYGSIACVHLEYGIYNKYNIEETEIINKINSQIRIKMIDKILIYQPDIIIGDFNFTLDDEEAKYLESKNYFSQKYTKQKSTPLNRTDHCFIKNEFIGKNTMLKCNYSIHLPMLQTLIKN